MTTRQALQQDVLKNMISAINDYMAHSYGKYESSPELSEKFDKTIEKIVFEQKRLIPDFMEGS